MAKPSLAFGLIGALIGVSPVLASDWTITSRLSQTLEANNNYFMSQDPKGPTYRSYSTLYLDSLYRTATTRQLLSGDISYFKNFGPGTEDQQGNQGINNGAFYQFEQFGKRPKDRDFFSAAWRRSDVASAQLADTGTITSSGNTNLYTVDAGFTRELTVRDTITLLARATANTFDNEEQNFTDLLGSARVTHAFSALTDLIASVDFDWMKYNDVQNTKTEFWKVMGGFVTRPTSQLTIRGNLGMALANTSADTVPAVGGTGAPPPPPVVPPVSTDPNSPPPLQPVQSPGSALTWIGDVYVTYKEKTTTYNLFASKFVSPDTLGALQQRTAFGMSVQHDINYRSSWNLGGVYSLTKSGRGENQNTPADLNLFATYDYRFTRELRGQLGYTFRANFPDNATTQTTTSTIVPPVDNSTITSHGVFAVLTADVTLKP